VASRLTTRVWRGRCVVIALACVLAACASGPAVLTQDRVNHLPASYVITGLPFHPQIEDQCGPATLATMLASNDVTVSPETLRGKIYIPGKQGSLTTEMVARARRYGLLVYPLQPQLSDILLEVAADNPVLVMQNLGFEWAPRWHFSIVLGFDRERQRLTMRSGNDPFREVSFALFTKTWNRAQRWAAVMVGPDKLPATAVEGRYVIAASELELVGELAAAARAYNTALKRWPGSQSALLGAGNVAYAEGLYPAARGFFADYAGRYPSSAAGWNNLAYTLHHLGCWAEAAASIECAVKLEPNNPAWRESQRELGSAPPASSASFCHMPVCP
jgi:Tetratricopeptide repeat/Peptidase_C39 like family